MLTELNPQDIGNIAWSFASRVVLDRPLRKSLAAESMKKISQFRVQEVEMMLWSVSQLHSLLPAQRLLKLAAAEGLLSPRGAGAILTESEVRGLPRLQARILFQAAGTGLDGVSTVALNLAATRLACAGYSRAALAWLHLVTRQGQHDDVTKRLEVVLGASASMTRVAEPLSGYAQAINSLGDNSRSRGSEISTSKAALLLPYVLRHSTPGDPLSVCTAIENFATCVLHPTRQWFKIAGGPKAGIITEAVRGAPARGALLEIGTYFGYSAIRMAIANPGRRIISLEVEPVHALVAQYLIMHAGLTHVIDVWTGHSKDTVPRLFSRYPAAEHGGPLPLAAVFMDQCGSRFWDDLTLLMQLGALGPGTVIIADNVLKPGAPRFLWHIFSRDDFDARVISVEEFGMPGVEDWIAVATYHPNREQSDADLPHDEPHSVWKLEFEAQQVRLRAANVGSMPFEEWAVFVAQMRDGLIGLGVFPDSEIKAAGDLGIGLQNQG